MEDNISAELRERVRLRQVQGADAVPIEKIRGWLAAESRASEHLFTRQVTSATLAELDAARARVADCADHLATSLRYRQERDAARARVAELEAELAKVKGHRAELSERCYRKDLELDELRERVRP